MSQASNEQRVIPGILRKMPLCPKCEVELGYRVRRGFIFKNLLSWLPLKRYYCYKCKQKHYLWH